MVAAGSSRPSTSSPHPILYLDPHVSERRRTVQELEASGDVVIETAATPAALRDALAGDHEHSCVVLEYELDGTDGISLYRSLDDDDLAAVPFVLYTANGDETLASEAITAGLSGYVPKDRTDSIDRLREQLRTVIDGASASNGAARRRKLERYRTLVETVGDSMYVLDSTGRIELVNEAMADRLGKSRTELVGAHSSEFIRSEDVERGREILMDLIDDDRRWCPFEMRVEPAEGEPYIAENNVAPLVDEDGEFAGSVGVVRDITDRKEREQRIRHLHEGTRELMAAEGPEKVAHVASEIASDALSLELNSIFLYDEHGNRSPNRFGERSDGSRSDVESRSSGVLVPVAVTDQTEALLDTIPLIGPGDGIAWDAFEAGEAMVHGDVRFADNVRNPETKIRSEAHIPLGNEGLFIVSSTIPNDFDAETLTLARILAANVEAALERARREDELAARSAELERQNERLESFASTVSHDLRNPLTLANGHLESLADLVGDDGERHVGEIEWALDRMDELIENVLTLARSGRRLTETSPVDLAAAVDQARRTVDPDLDVRCEEPLPTVDADEARLRVLFENVLRNAREHAGEDVRVTVRATDDGFAIEDDGPGVPPEERDAILEWGYSTATEGTGFGLAIVSEVVDAHGWSLALEESDAGGLRLSIACRG